MECKQMLKHPAEDQKKTSIPKSAASSLDCEKTVNNFFFTINARLSSTETNNVNGESNDVFSVGIAGRYKFSKSRRLFVGEYYHVSS
jgi:hypothetical protein